MSATNPLIADDLRLVNEQGASEILGGVPIETLRHWRKKSVNKGPRYIRFDNGSVRYRLRDLTSYMEEKIVETESRVNV